MHTSRLTVVSREAKKKQHACTSSGLRDHYSELFTWMAARDEPILLLFSPIFFLAVLLFLAYYAQYFARS